MKNFFKRLICAHSYYPATLIHPISSPNPSFFTLQCMKCSKMKYIRRNFSDARVNRGH